MSEAQQIHFLFLVHWSSFPPRETFILHFCVLGFIRTAYTTPSNSVHIIIKLVIVAPCWGPSILEHKVLPPHLLPGHQGCRQPWCRVSFRPWPPSCTLPRLYCRPRVAATVSRRTQGGTHVVPPVRRAVSSGCSLKVLCPRTVSHRPRTHRQPHP